MRKDTPEEFMRYLTARLELFPKFVSVNPKYPVNITNEVLFREEFTYQNWLLGKLGKNNYTTGFPTISSKGASMFGQIKPVEGDVTEGYTYSIYRFVEYNFKRIVYIDGVRVDPELRSLYKAINYAYAYGYRGGLINLNSK